MKTLKEKSICILYGGHPSEREVSLRTGNAVYKALVDAGYENVTLLDLDGSNSEKLLDVSPDVCFIAIHGKYGEDGLLQGYLEMLMIPYTGSGVSASAVAFDKTLSKFCFESRGVPTPPHYVAEGDELPVMYMPCVVKPAREGSTVGVTIAYSTDELFKGVKLAAKYDSKVMVEKYIQGKELTISVINGEVLPPIWIKPASGFYDYHSKYTKGATEYLFDLDLTDIETELVKNTALKAYESLGCEGVARVDIIYDGQIPYVLEVNTVPGMTETSLLPKAAERAGLSFTQLVERMLMQACKKWKC